MAPGLEEELVFKLRKEGYEPEVIRSMQISVDADQSTQLNLDQDALERALRKYELQSKWKEQGKKTTWDVIREKAKIILEDYLVRSDVESARIKYKRDLCLGCDAGSFLGHHKVKVHIKGKKINKYLDGSVVKTNYDDTVFSVCLKCGSGLSSLLYRD